MLGNDSTRAFFASAHVIQVLSNVWAEWNYNSIVQPYVTHSTSANPIYFGPDKGVSGSWAAINADYSASFITASYNNPGRDSTSTNKIIPTSAYFSSGNNSGSNISTQISLGSNNRSGIISASYKSLSTLSGFYKVVFFVKGKISYTSGYLNPVSSLNIRSAGVGNKPGIGTASYSYLVQSIGIYGQMSNFLESPIKVAAGVQIPTSSSPINIYWSSPPGNATAFNIYRATNNTSGSWSTFAYLDTIQNSIDDNNSVIDYFDKTPSLSSWNTYPAFNTEKIFLTPLVNLYNDSYLLNHDSYVRYIDINGGASIYDDSTIKLDGLSWQKIEVFFTNNSIPFNIINLQLNAFALFSNPTFNITPMWIYPITEFEYTNSKLFPLESVFSGRRPGEALLNPFISTLNSRGLNYYTDQSAVSNPIRNLTYTFMNPNNVWNIDNNMQIVPSYFDKYQYYISDSDTYPYSVVQAKYDQYLNLNKIYIKINTQLTTIKDSNSSSLTLYFNTANGTASSLYIPGPFKFDNNGISVFYYKNSQWINGSGSAFSASVSFAANLGSTTSGGWLPPNIANNGQIATNQIFVNLTGIKLALNYTKTSAAANLTTDDQRLHLVEVSPRLEVDLTDYIESYTFNKELDRGDTSANFPLGYITSNNGNIVINNFPVYYNNAPFTIFENKSPQSTFYDLMRQGVKFTGYLYSPSKRTDFNQPIPAFSLYADTWEINDIDNINVSLYDSTQHYMMSNEAPQYVAKGESLFSILTHLLALSGFSDYSQKELKEICKQRNNLAYFWTDEQKSTIQCLQELFIANQIGAFIDETGFMRFIDIDKIINRKKLTYSASSIDFLLSDSTTASWNNWANIVEGSYHESLSPRIGKIIVNYMQPNTSLSPVYKTVAGSLPTQTITTKKVFSEDTSMGLGHGLLAQSMNKNKHEFTLYVNGNLDLYNSPRNNPGTYAGNFFIGCEAVYAEGMEYTFVTSGSPGYSYSKIIRTESDIQDAIQESLSQLGTSQKDVTYKPTGKFVGVSRGMYGTSIKDHSLMLASSFVSPNEYTWFFGYSYGDALKISNPKTITITADSTISINKDSSFDVYCSPGNWSLLRPAETSNAAYDHFSFKFKVDQAGKIASQGGVGFFYNLYLNGGGPGVDTSGTAYKWNKTPMFFIEKVNNQSSRLSMCLWNGKQNFYLDSDKNDFILLEKDLFDGKEHRVSIWFDGKKIFYRIDDDFINSKSVYVISKGGTGYIKQNNVTNTSFGVFTYGANASGTDSDSSFTVKFSEIYACEWNKLDNGDFDLQGNPKYHIQTKSFLSDMVYSSSEIGYFLWQNRPHIIGFKHYKNTKFQIGPIFINNNKSDYMGYELNSQNNNELLRIKKEDLTTSYPKLSPFYFNQIIANNTSGMSDRRTLLILNSTNGSIANSYGQTINITPYQLEAEVLNLSTETSYQRTINTNHINNSIGIQTNWIQSEKDAQNLVSKVANLLSTFNSNVTIDIFGNPLIETGDIVGMWYKLKGIGFDSSGNVSTPQRYFVSTVSQTWDGSLKTSLVLKPL